MPSRLSFQALGASDDEISILESIIPFSEKDDEYSAFIVLTALRNNKSVINLLELTFYSLDLEDRFTLLLQAVTSEKESDIRKVYWSVASAESSDVLFLATVYLLLGSSYLPFILRMTLKEDFPNRIPVKWMENYKRSRVLMVEEGVFIEPELLFALSDFYVWEEIVGFLAEDVNLRRVLSMRRAGMDDKNISIHEKDLPDDLLEELFGI